VALYTQIDTKENEQLVELFSATHRSVVRHAAGHIVPTGKTLIAQYRAFFSAQCSRADEEGTARTY
jgi:hypothetical protein